MLSARDFVISDGNFQMEKAGVIVTPGASFGPHGEGYVRFALVLPPEKIREAVEAIRKSGLN